MRRNVSPEPTNEDREMNMLIEIHMMQNFAPSNLNRDDTGSPKDCQFGGYRRARISSQCLKRAIRNCFKADRLLAPENLAVRTRQLVSHKLVPHLAQGNRSADDARRVVEAALE